MKTIDEIEVELNDSQAMIVMINANITYCLWPRAGGKTSGGIGPRIQRLSQVMPRSQILIVSDTYDRLVKRVIPNIINFFIEKLGLIDGLDFVKYKKPTESWAKPIIPLDNFEHVISFPSGMALCLVSLAVPGSANAYNAQAALFDETKFLNENDINTEVVPALRGAEKEFGHLPEYLSKWFFTDKYGPNIKWLLAKRKLVDKDAVAVVYTLQEAIIKLEQEIEDGCTQARERENKRLITVYRERVDRMRKHMVYVSEMQPYENRKVVGEFYFKSQKRTCTQYEFDVAILNKDPDKVESCFYPTFTQKNKYAGIKDVLLHEPFIGAMDYQFRISPLPVCQVSILPGREVPTVNINDYTYALNPKGLEDAVKEFCHKHRFHQNKTFHFIYDQTAIGRNPIKTTFKDEVVKAFTACGWDVIEHFIGEQPDHDIKHKAIKNWLDNTGEYAVMMNQVTCDQLIKSIEQSPAIIVSGQTKKDKKTEKDLQFPAEDSTHGSDAFDMLLWGLFEYDIINSLNATGIDITFGK